DNALRLLELYGRPEVPVAWGASRPLVQPPRLAPHVHGVNGLGGVELPAPTGKPCEESAAELLVRLARENPGELDVLAVGPLTNLALALALEPRLPDLVRRLVVMGGAVRDPGNVGPHAEANVANDPEAAEVVFEAGFTLDLVALDVTMRTVATAEWLTELSRVPGERAERTSEFLAFYSDFYTEILGERQCVMHDPLAAAVLVDPHLVEGSYRTPLRVELNGTFTRGMTVADLRPRPSKDERHPVRVITDVAEADFLGRMLDSLRGADPSHQPPGRGPAAEFVPVGQLELAQHRGHVCLDGLDGDEQLLGHFLVGVATGDVTQDLTFALGEAVQFGVDRWGIGRGERVQDETGQARRKDRVTIGHPHDGVGQFLAGDGLGDVSAGPTSHDADDVLGRVGDRQRQEADPG